MRDYNDWLIYVNDPGPTANGVLGIGDNATHNVAAFRMTLVTGPGLVENYYGGTLVHELAHFLDRTAEWLSYAPGGGVGLTSYSAGTGVGSWDEIIYGDNNASTLDSDVDRFNDLNSCTIALNNTHACSYTGTYWERWMKELGIYIAPTGIPATDLANRQKQNKEIFAYYLQKRSGAATYPFLQYVEGKVWALSPHSIRDKMDYIWTNGHP